MKAIREVYMAPNFEHLFDELNGYIRAIAALKKEKTRADRKIKTLSLRLARAQALLRQTKREAQPA